MTSRRQFWLKWAAIALAAPILLVVLLPWLARILRLGFGLGIGLVALVGYMLVFLGLPFLAFIVVRAVYAVFFKPYLRAWRINRIRNQRYLREAANRD